jgi:alpha-tubulin suppressor-like RCC1 family protein
MLTEPGLYVWGSSLVGQCGTGSKDALDRPTRLKSFDKRRLTHITCGDHMSVAVEDSRRLWIWGKGLVANVEHSTPQLLHEFDSDVRQIAAGQSHLMVLMGN